MEFIKVNTKTGKNLEDIKQLNRGLIITIMQKYGIMSRAEISNKSGLKQSTITNIINEFIELNISKEVGMMRGNKNRRSIGVDLNHEELLVIALRIAREYMEIALFSIKCETISYNKVMYSGDAIYEILSRQLMDLQHLTEGKIVLGAGIAIASSLVNDNKIVPIVHELLQIDLQKIMKTIKDTYNIPVFIENDANLAAYAEWSDYFDLDDNGTLLFINVGTGIGSGFVIDGKIFKGQSGIAGEIGHMSLNFNGPKCECGNRGCLQIYVSGIALSRILKEKLSRYNSELHEDSHIPELIEAYSRNDLLAIEIIEEMSTSLGFGISNMINILNPTIIVLYGTLFKIPDMFNKASEKALNNINASFANVMIKMQTMDKNPILIGACKLVINRAIISKKIFNKTH